MEYGIVEDRVEGFNSITPILHYSSTPNCFCSAFALPVFQVLIDSIGEVTNSGALSPAPPPIGGTGFIFNDNGKDIIVTPAVPALSDRQYRNRRLNPEHTRSYRPQPHHPA